MADGIGNLWHVNFKINSKTKSFNLKFHLCDTDEETALVRANLIAAYLKPTLPATARIFYATISRDNTKKDSKYLKDAIGVGTFESAADPAVEDYDNPQTALLVRFENTDGGSRTMKFCPVPDEVVTGGNLVAAITPAIAPVALPLGIPGSGADWYADFTLLLKYLVISAQHVVSGHEPGGPYTYFDHTAAYPMRVGIKKGGKISV